MCASQLDIDKRYTAEQVMKCDWVTTSASDKVLADTQKALKKYMANQRLRKAALGIIAQQKMTKALAALREAQ